MPGGYPVRVITFLTFILISHHFLWLAAFGLTRNIRWPPMASESDRQESRMEAGFVAFTLRSDTQEAGQLKPSVCAAPTGNEKTAFDRFHPAHWARG